MRNQRNIQIADTSRRIGKLCSSRVDHNRIVNITGENLSKLVLEIKKKKGSKEMKCSERIEKRLELAISSYDNLKEALIYAERPKSAIVTVHKRDEYVIKRRCRIVWRESDMYISQIIEAMDAEFERIIDAERERLGTNAE